MSKELEKALELLRKWQSRFGHYAGQDLIDEITNTFLASQQAEPWPGGLIEHRPEQAEGVHVPDTVFEAEFAEWWEEDGQYCRSGGGDYERTFAFQAWRHLYPQLMAARAALAEHAPEPEKAEGAQGERETLPYWEPCNPGCDPEFNGQRSKYCAQLCHNARAALAQPSPAPELERPDVVAHRVEWKANPKGSVRRTFSDREPTINLLSMDYPSAVLIGSEPLMTVAQHERILRQALGASDDQSK